MAKNTIILYDQTDIYALDRADSAPLMPCWGERWKTTVKEEHSGKILTFGRVTGC